jgi:hypothetical protein
VLVHAGAGGLGSTLIQLARHLGAHVATTTSTRTVELVRSLGAETVVDYTKDDFSQQLSGYDLVIDSLGGTNLEKSLAVLSPGGLAIGVAGPPDARFAKQIGAPAPFGLVMSLLGREVRRKARSLGVRYEFLFMRADGSQLAHLAERYDTGHLRPVVDQSSPSTRRSKPSATSSRARPPPARSSSSTHSPDRSGSRRPERSIKNPTYLAKQERRTTPRICRYAGDRGRAVTRRPSPSRRIHRGGSTVRLVRTVLNLRR